jgi:O-acetyl-ADP-ribose deacetylase (regulator of RNase III)
MKLTELFVNTLTMQIEYRKGKMFEHDFSKDYEKRVIMHGCNKQGVMGSGVAKEFKQRYPEAFERYRSDIQNGLRLGDCSFSKDSKTGVYLASAITQEFYGKDGKQYASYEAIESNLAFIMKMFNTVVMPKIGCGLGGCDWNKIEPMFDKWQKQDLKIYVYSL